MTASDTTPRGRCQRLSRLRSQLSTATLMVAARTVAAATPTTRQSGRTGLAAAGVAVAKVAAVTIAVLVVTGAMALATAPPAAAGELVLAQPASFEALITNLRNWVVGLLFGLSTLFITVGGIRLLAADGDPGEVERGKRSVRNGLVGYAVAVLAPMIVTALQSLVGG